MPGDQCYDVMTHHIPLWGQAKHNATVLTAWHRSIWVWSVLGRICVCVAPLPSLVGCYLVKARMITISYSQYPGLLLTKGRNCSKFSLYCSVLVELSNKRGPQAVNWKYRLDWTRYSHTINCPPALLYFLSLRFAVFLVKLWWIGPIFPLSNQEFLNFLLSPFEKCGNVARLVILYLLQCHLSSL